MKQTGHTRRQTGHARRTSQDDRHYDYPVIGNGNDDAPTTRPHCKCLHDSLQVLRSRWHAAKRGPSFLIAVDLPEINAYKWSQKETSIVKAAASDTLRSLKISCARRMFRSSTGYVKFRAQLRRWIVDQRKQMREVTRGPSYYSRTEVRFYGQSKLVQESHATVLWHDI